MDLFSNNINFEDINNLHNEIETLGETLNCSSYDINKMINYYEKSNVVIDILKKISSTRNKLIVYFAQNSILWEKNLNDIKSKLLKLKNIDKSNSVIEILKKIATLRNKYIVYYAQKSNLWNKNLNDIKSKFKRINNKNISLDKVENAFVKVLKSYKYDWDGLWSIIDISKSGKIKNICLFDYNDNIELFEILSR